MEAVQGLLDQGTGVNDGGAAVQILHTRYSDAALHVSAVWQCWLSFALPRRSGLSPESRGRY